MRNNKSNHDPDDQTPNPKRITPQIFVNPTAREGPMK